MSASFDPMRECRPGGSCPDCNPRPVLCERCDSVLDDDDTDKLCAACKSNDDEEDAP